MNEKTTITEDLQHLFTKTTDANKLFLTEGAKFIKNISASNLKGADIFANQTELFKQALNLFVKLNIEHTSNLIDLGSSIARRMNSQPGTADENSSQEEQEIKPAFVLNMKASPGTRAITQFLLDSDKKEPVICNLKQTEFVSQADPSVKSTFKTLFAPQSFTLNFGEPQKVEIIVEVPDTTTKGVYLANVQVDGFEHTYFSLFLDVFPDDKNDSPALVSKAARKPRQRKSR